VPRLLVYSDAPMVGGAETSLRHLLVGLDRRFDVTLMGEHAAVVEDLGRSRPGTRVVAVRAVSSKRDVRGVVRLARAIRREHADVLHANLTWPLSCRWPLVAGAIARQRNVVAVEQLPWPLDAAQSRTKRRLERFVDVHVAVGDEAAREIERDAGLTPQSIETIYNGVPDVDVPPRPRPFDGFTVGSLGRFHPQKGYDVLLDAIARMRSTAAVVLVGDGDERPALEHLRDRLQLSDRVLMTGWQEQPRAWLGALDVFVLPSRAEGFPLSITEAMLARRPVVAAAVGSVGEAVVDGETGLLVPPDDPVELARALDSLADEPARRDAMGEAGRARALEHFTSARMAERFEAVYDRLLDGGARGGRRAGRA
jgi:glycosyltransferase involved in cell wall biosynthesis